MTFRINRKFSKSSHHIIDLKLCSIRLHDNSKFPWVILIPKRNNVTDISDLNSKDQILLMKEIVHISKIMKKLFKTSKLNVEKIGNIEFSQSDDDGNQKQIIFQSGDLEFFLFADDYIDIDIEIKKLNKKIDNLEKTLSVSKSRLENEKFVQNAKEELIQKEKQNILDVENEIKLLKETRDQFSV